jgi:hypothetical protein
MPNCDFMQDLPDYRSEKMDSSEGRGIAAARFADWTRTLPDDVIAAAGFDERFVPVNDEIAVWAATTLKEFTELMGFWIAWHRVGGFERLEAGGWNRATIFRKIRRFRAVFGVHPDEYHFPWIQLDLDAIWHEDLLHRLGVEPEPTKDA